MTHKGQCNAGPDCHHVNTYRFQSESYWPPVKGVYNNSCKVETQENRIVSGMELNELGLRTWLFRSCQLVGTEGTQCIIQYAACVLKGRTRSQIRQFCTDFNTICIRYRTSYMKQGMLCDSVQTRGEDTGLQLLLQKFITNWALERPRNMPKIREWKGCWHFLCREMAWVTITQSNCNY